MLRSFEQNVDEIREIEIKRSKLIFMEGDMLVVADLIQF